MIPKIIHYCWLSDNPIPSEAEKYISNWKKILPDYKFILWNFDKFDINSSLWVRQAFEYKKYAFAADYIRLHALYEYGGIYLDMDVEVVKSFDPLLQLNTMLCYEDFGDRFEMATLGVAKQSIWVGKMLEYYQDKSFLREDGTPDLLVVPKIAYKVFNTENIKTKDVVSINEALEAERAGYLPIFSSDFFSPKAYSTGRIQKTDNTYSIHHFVGSWLPNYVRWEHKFWQFLGLNDPNLTKRVVKLFQRIKWR